MINKLSAEEQNKALLLLNNEAVAPWQIINEKLSREFKFKTFVLAFEFMKKVAVLADEADHHPEWSNIYNKVNIQLTTHDAKGVSIRDFNLATAISKIEKQA